MKTKSLIILFFISISIRIIYFYFSVHFIPPTTDESLAMLIAQAINNGERPLLFWGAPYQFPTESYLISIFSSFLPHNAFGSRIILFLIGLCSIFGFYFVLKKFNKENKFSLLLILIPSAYVLTLTSSYFIPEYTITLTFFWLLPLLYLSYLKNNKIIYLILIALISGFSLSTHLLSLPLVFVLGVILCIGNSLKTMIKNTLVYIPCLLIGLIPYFLSLKLTGEASKAITGNFPLIIAFKRLFSDLILTNLHVVLGLNYTLFPDFEQLPGPFFKVAFIFNISIIFLLFYLIFQRFFYFIKESFKNRWPTFKPIDLFLGTTLASLIAFSLSKRGDYSEYRYLLVVCLFLPFIFSYFLTVKNKFIATYFKIFIILLVFSSFFNSVKLLTLWKNPEIINTKIAVPNITKVLNFLERKEFKYCFATFWDVNRFTYESNNKIKCTQPYNERFLGYPLHYLDEVNNTNQKVAYILTNERFQRLLGAFTFMQLLDSYGIKYKFRKIGRFYVIFKFHYSENEKSNELNVDQFKYNLQSNIINIENINNKNIDRILIRVKNEIPSSVQYDLFVSDDKINWKNHNFKTFYNKKGVYIKNKHPIFHNKKSIDLLTNSLNAKYIKVENKNTFKDIDSISLIGSE